MTKCEKKHQAEFLLACCVVMQEKYVLRNYDIEKGKEVNVLKFVYLFWFLKLIYATASKTGLSRCSVVQTCKTRIDHATLSHDYWRYFLVDTSFLRR